MEIGRSADRAVLLTLSSVSYIRQPERDALCAYDRLPVWNAWAGAEMGKQEFCWKTRPRTPACRLFNFWPEPCCQQVCQTRAVEKLAAFSAKVCMQEIVLCAGRETVSRDCPPRRHSTALHTGKWAKMALNCPRTCLGSERSLCKIAHRFAFPWSKRSPVTRRALAQGEWSPE